MTSVAAGQVERVEEERPDLPTRLGDALALGLRLREGIDLDALGARLGLDVRAAVGPVIDELIAAGCLEWHGGPPARRREQHPGHQRAAGPDRDGA